MILNILLSILLIQQGSAANQPEDRTREDVVDAALQKVNKLNIKPFDYEYYKRIAYIFTEFGENYNNAKVNFTDNIWGEYRLRRTICLRLPIISDRGLF